MRFRHLLAASLCLATALPASAQSLRRDQGPVNFPPSSFTGSQFVDNRGCVYIRAGFQGAVSWVPRVGRDRRLLCGQRPTFPGSGTSAAAAAPAPTPAPAPRQTTVTTTESQPRQTTRPSWLTRTPSPAPGPSVVSRPAETSTRVPSGAVVTVREAPIRTITSLSDPVMAPAPAATPTVRTVVAPAPVPQTTTRPQTTLVVKPMTPRRGLSVCPNRTGISAQHTNTVGVRCGPQAEDPRGTGGTLTSTTENALVTDIRRRLGADAAVLRIEGGIAPIPKGYEPVFKDGRHNPNRGLPGGVASLHSGTGVYTASARGYGPYVQAATFASSANAQATVARLSSMGLPVSTRSVRSGGRTLTVVLAGPFSDAASRNRALQQVRAAGFRDAFARR